MRRCFLLLSSYYPFGTFVPTSGNQPSSSAPRVGDVVLLVTSSSPFVTVPFSPVAVVDDVLFVVLFVAPFVVLPVGTITSTSPLPSSSGNTNRDDVVVVLFVVVSFVLSVLSLFKRSNAQTSASNIPQSAITFTIFVKAVTLPLEIVGIDQNIAI
jgi:hypothetical protein